jgi:hypothetical protein
MSFIRSKLPQDVMLVICIREVPDSNVGWDIDCIGCGSRGFPQSRNVNEGIRAQKRLRLPPYTSLPV